MLLVLKKRHRHQWNKIEILGLNPGIYYEIVFDNVAQNPQESGPQKNDIKIRGGPLGR
jgi:hypothetical protein